MKIRAGEVGKKSDKIEEMRKNKEWGRGRVEIRGRDYGE